MPASKKVPITPSVLEWTIVSSGMSRAEVAIAVGVSEEAIGLWLNGTDQPGVSAFRKLAQVLRRPTATFFLRVPPNDAPPAVEFRPAPGGSRRNLLVEEHLAIREAARLQRATAWLSGEVGETPVDLPRIRRGTAPETAAGIMRDRLGIAVDQQLGWKNPSHALREWRAALERNGIIVLLSPMGANSARGFSIWDDVAPLIAANTHWNAAARGFTLLHELGHLITRTSSICEEVGHRAAIPNANDIERWCERFAAAVLMPEPAVEQALARIPNRIRTSRANLRTAETVSRTLHVSLRAAALRLIELDQAEKELYGRIPPAQDGKERGGAGRARTRTEAKLDHYGRRVTTTVLAALKRELIDSSTALRYLDVSYEGLSQLAALAGE